MKLPPKSAIPACAANVAAGRHNPTGRASVMKQRGAVLFFALIALLVLSLAAVALIRSVDTSTMIAGNLTFKQAATSSADAGVNAAISWLAATQTANNAKNVLTDATHAFNITSAASGYYSNADPLVSLTSGTGIQWTNADSVQLTWDTLGNVKTDGSGAVTTDSSGNTVRYVIQRMCRNANQPVQTAGCLFSSALQDNNGQNIPLPSDICQGAGCPSAGAAPQIRITVRVSGTKNTVSYVQAFVY